MNINRLILTSCIIVLLSACAVFPGMVPPPNPTLAPQPTSVEPTRATSFTPVPTPTPQLATPPQPPVLIRGGFKYTNSIITDYYVEHAVALVDIYGFIKRDKEWELPVDMQILGYLTIDEQKKEARYLLHLPARPIGSFADVDNNEKKDIGVQVFVVAYWPNLFGGPFSDKYDPSFGWPAYLASTKHDTENNDEVIGGKLIIWAPDDKQSFPTGFGADGLLFTKDDPVAPVPAGYSIIDLDQKPFKLIREPEPQVTLYEPQDVALKDFSRLSYSEAFEKMFEIIKKEYAFNGIKGKQPDWDAVYKDISAKVKQAETKRDPTAFYLALRDFTYAFKDGHVGLDGGQIENTIFTQTISNGYGFAIRELDNGKVVVVYVLEGGPAAKAGVKVGAVISEFNGIPIKDAIGQVKPLSLPHSTDFALRYQQARYLLRARQGDKAKVTFTNPNETKAQSVELAAIPERQSFSFTSTFRGFDSNALPVTFRILESGVGYIKISSNYDDLNLIIRLFERALKTFEANELDAIIIDMRQNSGGAPLGLAGFLYDKEIPLGQLQYFSERTGKFEADRPRDRVLPMPVTYKFKKMALMVDQSCASACEIESYGFSKVPGMIVVGMFPSAGVEAEVARGQFLLPEKMSLQVPTGRFIAPDGSIWLEGVGVQPTLKVPITEETVLTNEDVVLLFAVQAVLR